MRKLVQTFGALSNSIIQLQHVISKANLRKILFRWFIVVTAITLCALFLVKVPYSSFLPDNPVLFPYLPPPQGPSECYLETTVDDMTHAILGAARIPFKAERYKGQSFIFKEVKINEWTINRSTENYLTIGIIRFVAQNPSDLEKIKIGDTIEILGICAGTLNEWPIVTVFTNCLFFPAGTTPLPLPGGQPPLKGGY